jgi:hypothetical protein
LAEHVLGKDEVGGSSPLLGFQEEYTDTEAQFSTTFLYFSSQINKESDDGEGAV